MQWLEKIEFIPKENLLQTEADAIVVAVAKNLPQNFEKVN